MGQIKIYHLDDSVLPTVVTELRSCGYKVYEVDTDAVTDQDSFYRMAIARLPMGEAQLNPSDEWRFPTNWEGFSDFLWQGLFDQTGSVAFVWPRSDRFKIRMPELYDISFNQIVGVMDVSGGIGSSYSLYLGGQGEDYGLNVSDS